MASSTSMRSPRAFAASLILLVGIALALGAGMSIGYGAEAIIHIALALAFLLIAFAVFDFDLPEWINLIAGAAMAAFCAIFALQAAHDIAPSEPLRRLAFEVLGQTPEKALGYVFLVWCLGVLVGGSGKTRLFGAVAFVVIVCAEIYSFVIAQSGQTPPGALKLLYLPLFVWLLLEARKPVASAEGPSPGAPRSR